MNRTQYIHKKNIDLALQLLETPALVEKPEVQEAHRILTQEYTGNLEVKHDKRVYVEQ